MTDIIVAPFDDTRTDGPMLGGEREVLEHWLELYRVTVLHKIAGLDAGQLAQRSVSPSTLSLAGVVRHLAEVEAYWLREVLHGEDVPDIWCVPGSPDGDIDDATAATAAEDVARYRTEVDLARARQAEWPDLESPAVGTRHGKNLNLRWILTHLIEEYARHLGQMDLLREAVDGATGY